jgi:hypothetical protein
MIERWVRSWLTGRPKRRPVQPSRAHTHFCADGDHRWPCRVDPCLRHDVAACPDPTAKDHRAEPALAR